MKTLDTGDQLDQYRIDSEIARSGMSTLYRATMLDTGKTVAIKIPHPELEADPILYDRFHREELIGQEMNHPGVVKVLPSEGRSRVYMAMEWIDGTLLRDIIKDHGKLPINRATNIAIQIAEALDHACHDFAGVDRARVVPSDQDAADLQLRVEPVAHLLDRIGQQGQTT